MALMCRSAALADWTVHGICCSNLGCSPPAVLVMRTPVGDHFTTKHDTSCFTVRTSDELLLLAAAMLLRS